VKATFKVGLTEMPKGPRRLTISFGASSLTHYGGVYVLHRFLTRIGFKNALASDIRLAQRNNRYSIGEMILALLYPMILGLERIETTQLLRQNGVFQYLTGLPSYPDATTLRRFLLRVAPTALPKLRALHDRFLERITPIPGPPSRVIFDVDSTVLVVTANRSKRASATTRSSVADPPTIRCSASRARAETSGTGNCGPAKPILPQHRRCGSDRSAPRAEKRPLRFFYRSGHRALRIELDALALLQI
jgi:hypothetical protein